MSNYPKGKNTCPSPPPNLVKQVPVSPACSNQSLWPVALWEENILTTNSTWTIIVFYVWKVKVGALKTLCVASVSASVQMLFSTPDAKSEFQLRNAWNSWHAPQAVLLWSWFLVHAACHLSFQFSIFVQDFPLLEHLHLRLDSCSPARPSPLPPPVRRACASHRQELSRQWQWRGYLWDALPILALLNLDLGQQRGVAVQVVVGLHLGDGHGHHHGDQDGNWTLGESGSGRVGDVEWGGDVGKGTLLCRRSSWSLTWCSVWIWLFWLCQFYHNLSLTKVDYVEQYIPKYVIAEQATRIKSTIHLLLVVGVSKLGPSQQGQIVVAAKKPFLLVNNQHHHHHHYCHNQQRHHESVYYFYYTGCPKKNALSECYWTHSALAQSPVGAFLYN